MPVELARLVLASQTDTEGLEKQLKAWGPERIARMALVYKVEGEYEDGSRERSRASVYGLLARHGLDRRAEMVTVVGCEGLATPFGYVLAEVTGDAPKGRTKRLAIGTARGAPPEDTDLDRAKFKSHIAKLTQKAMADAGLEAKDVVTVLVNTPQPTTGDKGMRGRKARAVAALGAGIAIGDVEAGAVTESSIMNKADLFTRRVQTFTGPTVRQVEVIVLGNRAGAGGDLVACATVADDLTDMRPLKRMLVKAGLELDRDGELARPERVVAMMIKSGVRPDGLIHGLRTTLFEPGLPVEKHVRAAQSGLMAGLIGTSAAFNTFDPIQQCPVGGSAACAIVRVG
jgi:ring-opening amidohydrolase-like protein